MKILQSAPCDAVFLGVRNYLHSTTIVPSLIGACNTSLGLGAIQQVSAQFHSLTDHHCRFDLLDVAGITALTQAGYVATFKVTGESAAGIIGLWPLEAHITERLPFDEDALVNGCQINGAQQTIALPVLIGDPLKTVVSLNKHLHARLFGSAGFGKWLLTRLDLGPAWFSGPAPRALELQLVAVLASVNTKAAILSEGRSLGSVHFSRKKEIA